MVFEHPNVRILVFTLYSFPSENGSRNFLAVALDTFLYKFSRFTDSLQRESDGRVRVTAPSNGFSDSQAIFPKGTLDGKSAQATKVILLKRLEIQGRDVVQNQVQSVLQAIASERDGGCFNRGLMFNKPGQQTIDGALGISHLKVLLQQLDGLKFRGRLDNSHEHQITIKHWRGLQAAQMGASQQCPACIQVRHTEQLDLGQRRQACLSTLSSQISSVVYDAAQHTFEYPPAK